MVVNKTARIGAYGKEETRMEAEQPQEAVSERSELYSRLVVSIPPEFSTQPDATRHAVTGEVR